MTRHLSRMPTTRPLNNVSRPSRCHRVNLQERTARRLSLISEVPGGSATGIDELPPGVTARRLELASSGASLTDVTNGEVLFSCFSGSLVNSKSGSVSLNSTDIYEASVSAIVGSGDSISARLDFGAPLTSLSLLLCPSCSSRWSRWTSWSAASRFPWVLWDHVSRL